ncbi:MAG: aminopeptidase N [Alphaproteobacteria bacterium]|nr:aminopeptidase N [Alphaproteobacteria bacterium]
MEQETPKTICLKDYRPPRFAVERVDLAFHLFDDRTVVRSVVRYRREQEEREPLRLDGCEQEVLSVRLDGRDLHEGIDFTLDENGLSLPCPEPEVFTLEIESLIHPEENTSLEGLYVSNGTFCTQCEAEGFRKITYYPDRPDVMALFTTRIEADKNKYPVLLSNGNRIEEGELPEGRHYAVWEDPFKKPAYLFALVAGDLEHIHDTFTTMSGRTVDLFIYCRKGDEDQCWHAMRSLQKSMKWDEDAFGREYDLDLFNIVAISDFNMGAMENKSLNIFNTALVLAHPETATDMDFLRVESVIGHEYFHNWTGNRITCRDWFQLSLKEGLTVYRDQEFSADLNSRAVQRIDDVVQLRRLQFPEDAGPLAHAVRPDTYIEISNFYTVTVYEKGAELIRMMETILGKDGFRKGMDLYFERHDGQAVTCMDFVQCMEDANGANLEQFRLWYEQAGTPEVTVRSAYDEAAKSFTLDFWQKVPATPAQPFKKPMHIPVKLGLVGPNGEDVVDTTLHLTREHESFTFENIGARPVPSVFRNFSAPVKLSTDQSDEDLRFLMVHDSDGFNRWEAGQTLALRQIGRMLDIYEKNGELVTDSLFVSTYSDLLDQAFDPEADKLLLAQAVVLPDIPIIAQTRKVVDPQAIWDVRLRIVQDIARMCHEKIEEIYHDHADTGTFGISPEAIARRSLRNIALRFLALSPNRPQHDLLRRHYDDATNMTDRVSALSSMIETDAPAWENSFADFRNRFGDYPLVMDKWFALQAMAVRRDTLVRARALRQDSDFNIRNPNRVRSLYAALAMNNPVCFHRPDGAGYEFLCEAIIDLNRINPAIASRLLTPLREWRRYTPDRQEKMKAALERIAAEPKLSKDVFEVVSKTLA